MKKLQLTGGARIGIANATFPFATLKVTRTKLEVNASIIGNLTFQPSDIISIEPYISIPFFGQGIKINHNVSSYKEKVIFWTFKNPKTVITQIQETGFLDNDNNTTQTIDRTITNRQSQGGFPIKKNVVIGAIVVWNILFLKDIIPFIIDKKEGFPVGNGILTGVGLLFITALLSLVSANFRQLILKEGRELNDIRKFAFFALLISGFMLLNLGLISKMFE